MASFSRLLWWAHLRSEPNEYILHYCRGRVARRGPGLAYWFNPLTAAIALVPVEDCEATFVLNDRTNDYQEVAVQITLAYRFAEAERAAARMNFSISLRTGAWIESPLEKLTLFWAQRARPPARTYLRGVGIGEAVRNGAEVIRGAVTSALQEDAEIKAMGMVLVSVQVDQVAPAPDLQKALETPTREAVQQKADEAAFQRRALAVEKERAIKENELATQIELARRHAELIRQQGANELQEVRQQAEAQRAQVEAEAERQALAAQANARDAQVRAEGDAQARRSLGEAEAAVQARMVDVWARVSPDILLGLALREWAGKIGTIQHLNITPDLVSEGLQRLLRRQAER